MNSRERVIRSFNHQEVDKTPIDFGGSIVTCLDYHAHKNLKRYMGIDDDNDPIIDYTMGTVSPCEQIMKAFGSDVRRIGMNVIPPEIKDNTFISGFGIKFTKAVPHEYFDVSYNPLSDADIEDIAKMQLPDPNDDRLYYGIKDKARDLYESSPYAIVADFCVPGVYETSQKLRGYEQLACDLLIDEELITALYDRLFELQKAFFKRYLSEVGKYVQAIGYADDLGMQDRLQMSPQTYQNIIKPYHKKIFGFIHEQADVKIMLHSCGAIEPIIDDLIDAGVDILNPLQTRAAGMSPELLKNKYGDRITFWGGIDEQQTLPFGSRDEIEAEVKKMLEIMGKDGGYILAPSHNIQEDTKPENVIAMFEAAKRFR